ncbi:MAG: amidohydrolase family protein, partial [Symbiobacteriaceae bacterium]|nr:amidohydrolase family protein [Symbiobacteriaceae bacterium]
PETMDRFCQIADAHNIQAVTHVIGDLAADETLDSYAKILRNGANPLRHGLIHLQISDTPILERIAAYGVTVHYQPVFLQYELHIVEQRVGKELASTSYAFGQADRLGIHVAYSSDAPVEDCNPLPNLYCAVTRQDFKGNPPGGFAPHQKVDLSTAIDAYTIGSAYCEFAENNKGRLRPGWLADITVLDRDIFDLAPDVLLETKVALTVVNGRIVYQA